LDKAEVPRAPAQSIDQVVKDPQVLARSMIVEQDHLVLVHVKLPNLPFRQTKPPHRVTADSTGSQHVAPFADQAIERKDAFGLGAETLKLYPNLWRR
jgi:crotonobetainyl-CoA:carnitine CoA-transferase CaiB-like acyl-CoA transferase